MLNSKKFLILYKTNFLLFKKKINLQLNSSVYDFLISSFFTIPIHLNTRLFIPKFSFHFQFFSIFSIFQYFNYFSNQYFYQFKSSSDWNFNSNFSFFFVYFQNLRVLRYRKLKAVRYYLHWFVYHKKTYHYFKLTKQKGYKTFNFRSYNQKKKILKDI